YEEFYFIFRFELKRFLCVGNLIILLLALYLVYNRVNGSQKMKTKVQEFKELESIIFSKILNYLHYSFQGFRVLYVPGESAIAKHSILGFALRFLQENSITINREIALNKAEKDAQTQKKKETNHEE
ncbi:MAG: hypothetical protein KAW12_04740, partial [Candidatus Aminicenantes bacterium]|nr:hypothetical protein [Candidatus Aminicenantes bacterium]